jgi:uncharacterized protein (TIGR02466 family)
VKTPRYFATPILAAKLQGGHAANLNGRLLRECLQLREDDAAGRRWSIERYPCGYTSYASVSRMQRVSPTFAALEKRLDSHVAKLARDLQLDLGARKLVMTDCWVNIMSAAATHSLHLHPLSVLSGTYYVQTPRGSPGLKFEDPRLDRFMAAPPRSMTATDQNRAWIVLPAIAGSLLLFESWLRHEVVAHKGRSERISISFNYA